MKFDITLQFTVNVDSGNRSAKEMISLLEKMYGENTIGETVICTKCVKKHDGLFRYEV